MGAISGIYDSDYLAPVAKIKENLSIWTLGAWSHYAIQYEEPIGPGPNSQVDMCVQGGVTNIAALGSIVKQVVTVLQLNDYEFLHVRFEPIDNVEGIIWEQAGTLKFASKNVQSKTDRYTRLWDPTMASTTFWVLGLNRDMNLQVSNPLNYAQPKARFQFWGIRYILVPWDFSALPANTQALLRQGDLATVRAQIGTTTWLPAEGRAS